MKSYKWQIFDIEQLIKDRLNYQSTQRALEKEFNILPEFNKIFNPLFLSNLKTWDQRKRDLFVKLLGGPVYFKQTKQYIEEAEKRLIKKRELSPLE